MDIIEKVKLQLGCLIVLLFMATVYFSSKRVKNDFHKLFSASLIASVINNIFDIITVYTVNHLDTVNPTVNKICHVIFLGSITAELYICFMYCRTLICNEENKEPKKNFFWSIPLVIAVLGIFFLPLYYVETPNGNYSMGAAVVMVYSVVACYTLAALIIIIIHQKHMNSKKRILVLLAYCIEIVISSIQALIPVSLISGFGIMLINLSFFLTLESPDVHLIELLRAEKQRADEANNAKSIFLSNMSHEIRTPMNAIVGLTDVMLRKDLPEDERGYMLNIKSSGTALLNLINDLLDFSKIESGKYVITEDVYFFVPLLRDICLITRTRIGDKGIRFTQDIDSSLPKELYGDSLRIRQVIINLLNNAVKYTDKGMITLSVKAMQRKENKIQLFISVRDTGIGIKQEDISKLFDAFSQVDLKTNSGKEGTGLGLAISSQLVSLMGGELKVESEYGKGSEFYFTIWQGITNNSEIGLFDEHGTDDRSDSNCLDFTAPEANILIVEDNEINCAVALALLKPLQMKIDTAENGAKALEMLESKKYHLVFMDQFMPVMDGIQATKKIRESEDEYYRSLPVIALTADAISGVREKLLNAGMDDFVSKPIDMKEICAKLKKWLPDDLIIKS